MLIIYLRKVKCMVTYCISNVGRPIVGLFYQGSRGWYSEKWKSLLFTLIGTLRPITKGWTISWKSAKRSSKGQTLLPPISCWYAIWIDSVKMLQWPWLSKKKQPHRIQDGRQWWASADSQVWAWAHRSCLADVVQQGELAWSPEPDNRLY